MNNLKIEEKIITANVYCKLAKNYILLGKLKKANDCVIKAKIITECMELVVK